MHPMGLRRSNRDAASQQPFREHNLDGALRSSNGRCPQLPVAANTAGKLPFVPATAFGPRDRRCDRHNTTPMRRSQLCADRDSGCTIPPMRTARKAQRLLRIVFGAMSIRVVRCQRLLISCAPRWPSSSRDCSSTWKSRKAPQMLAFLRADRSRRRHRIDDCCGEGQQVMEIAHCVARPPVCENYVKVCLTARGHGPRNSSITGPERSSSAHSCDLRIGVAMESFA